MNKNVLYGIAVVVIAAIAAWFYWSQRPVTPPVQTSLGVPGDITAVSPLGEMTMGKDDAPVTVIEYASLTCPHCANFHQKVFPEFKARYIDTGKVKFIFREFPRDDLDLFAYMLCRCIGKDKFFALVSTLFEQQDKWVVQNPLPPLTAIIKQAGFTDESIEACSKNKQVQEAVEWSRENAMKIGVDSTPSFFLNGKKFPNGFSLEEWDKAIGPLTQG